MTPRHLVALALCTFACFAIASGPALASGRFAREEGGADRVRLAQAPPESSFAPVDEAPVPSASRPWWRLAIIVPASILAGAAAIYVRRWQATRSVSGKRDAP